MKYLLDTNICIYWLKGNKDIIEKVQETDADDLYISTITVAELLYGAWNSTTIEKNLSKVREFENAISVFELDRDCIEMYAKIKAKLRAEGKILDDFDILIAATAIQYECVLVTNNIKHFERIDGLAIENWTA
jgi:tRNA(fMet)-specific endonuclease VapC